MKDLHKDKKLWTEEVDKEVGIQTKKYLSVEIIEGIMEVENYLKEKSLKKAAALREAEA